MKPFRLAAEYVVLIAWAFEMETLSELAEQIEYDEGLSAVEKRALEGYVNARERSLGRSFDT